MIPIESFAVGPRARLGIWASFASMFMLGVTISLLGPSLPGLALRTNLDLSAAGIYFTLFSSGSVVATALLARFMDRPSRHGLLVAGSLLMAAAHWWTSSSNTLLQAGSALVLAGISLSTVGAVPNAIIADAYRDRSGQALNALHVFVGIGSFIGPLLVGAAIRSGAGYPLAFRLCSLVMLLIAGVWLVSRPPIPRFAQRPAGTAAQAVRMRPMALLLAMGLLYTGTEQTIGGWLYSYASLATRIDATGASVITAFLWLSILLGRLVASREHARLNTVTVLRSGLALAGLGVVCLLCGTRLQTLLWLGVGLIGVGLGPIFPTLLALAAQTFSTRAGMSSSLVIAAGSTGAMLLPWTGGVMIPVVGIIGSMAASIVPLALLYGLLAVFARSDTTPPKHRQQ